MDRRNFFKLMSLAGLAAVSPTVFAGRGSPGARTGGSGGQSDGSDTGSSIGPGSGTPPGVAAASSGQVPRPLWMVLRC